MEHINLNTKKGLSSYQIKLIAMILMVFDHIYYYFSYTNSIPIQFKWLGRVVAPLFIFISQEGFYHTRDRVKMLSRLYISFVIMNLLNLYIPILIPRSDNIAVMHSMFGTLFLLGIHIIIYDYISENYQNKNIKKVILGSILMLLPSLLSILIVYLMPILPSKLFVFILTLIPLPLFVEGSIVFIILGLLFYTFRDQKTSLAIVYTMFCITFLPLRDLSFETILQNYQWMMIFALPIILNYNGEKGKDSKFLFYIFYPLHIYVLYIISALTFTN